MEPWKTSHRGLNGSDKPQFIESQRYLKKSYQVRGRLAALPFPTSGSLKPLTSWAQP